MFFLSYIFLGKYIIFPLLKTVSEETKEKVFFGLLIILRSSFVYKIIIKKALIFDLCMKSERIGKQEEFMHTIKCPKLSYDV